MWTQTPVGLCRKWWFSGGQTEGFPTSGVKMWVFGIHWKDIQGDAIKADEAINKGRPDIPDIAETVYGDHNLTVNADVHLLRFY